MLSALTPGRASHGGDNPPWLTLALTAAVVGAYLALGPAAAAWVFDRNAVETGEAWRLVSGHLMHADLEHLAWNVAAFLALGILLETTPGFPRWRYALALLTGSVAVGLALWGAVPRLAQYCGLSGVLNTLYVVLLMTLWRQTHKTFFPLLMVAGAIKIAVEWAQGTALFTNTAWPPVPEAHAAGFIAGVLLSLTVPAGAAGGGGARSA